MSEVQGFTISEPIDPNYNDVKANVVAYIIPANKQTQHKIFAVRKQ